MKLYLTRHGETIEGKEGIILGSLGGKLSGKGIEEARQIGIFLLSEKIKLSSIITSNLGRAIETGKIIAGILNIPLIQNKIINERSSGEIEGKREDEIDWELYEKKALPYRKHLGGESFINVKKRAKSFLDSIEKINKKDGILIITHSAFIAMLLNVILKNTIKKSLKIDIKNKIIVLDTNTRKIEFMKYL